MAARAVSGPLAQLPNALTVARLALIPVFVALVLAADDGHSWPPRSSSPSPASPTRSTAGSPAAGTSSRAFGKIADPLADRLMIDAAVLLLLLGRPAAVGRARDPGA